MSSAFDSEVYCERQRLPGVSINAASLMAYLLWHSQENTSDGIEPVSLTLEYRADVDTRRWWTIKWGRDCSASGKTLELCLFRAAVLARRSDKRAMGYAGMSEGGAASESLAGDYPSETANASEGIDCPECDGTGEVIGGNGVKGACGRCQGSGVVEAPELDEEPSRSDFDC